MPPNLASFACFLGGLLLPWLFFFVDQAVGRGYEPVGGYYGGGALYSGGGLKVKYCHEGRSLLTLSHKTSNDSVLTFPARLGSVGEKGEQEK